MLDDQGDTSSLVVVARDVTAREEIQHLREAYGRLAMVEAAQRTVVERLQEAVMPARLSVPGTELAVSYLASDPTAPTGGDLYDWQVLPSGEVHIAVVDVLGHGVAATKDALSVVHALRTLALQNLPLSESIAEADALLRAQHPDLVATVMIARFDPVSGHVRLATGGHPPCLLVSADGAVRPVPTRGGAIGWPGAGSDEVAEATLAPGDALVFYTDGLVEAKRDIIEGTERLIRLARELSSSPVEDLAAGLVHGTLDAGDRRDDALALVLRRVPALRRTWRLPPQPRHASLLRHDVATWLSDTGLPDETVADVQLLVAELVSNAVAAARSRIEVRVTVEGLVIGVEVEDDGRGCGDLTMKGLSLPHGAAESGRGLFIARSIADELDALSTYEGTVVSAKKRLTRAATPRPAARSLR